MQRRVRLADQRAVGVTAAAVHDRGEILAALGHVPRICRRSGEKRDGKSKTNRFRHGHQGD
jgi:hypothetical protein